ncbi:MAG TPA: AAA family ATPase [Candidatus Baltobacteraceae bacterium]|nr:AAA family ATPase [Candidatus Baltobacteraceae bacterium]
MTVNVLVLLAGAIVAIPLHESVVPAAPVLAVKLPEKPVSDASNVCADPDPVAKNDSEVGCRSMGEVLGVADGVGLGVGVGFGVAVGLGLGVGVAVADGFGVGVGLAVAVGLGCALVLGDGVGVGVAGETGTAVLVPPEPLHAAKPAATHSTAAAESRATGAGACGQGRCGMASVPPNVRGTPEYRPGPSPGMSENRTFRPGRRAANANSRRTAMLSPAIVCPELVGRNGDLEVLLERRRAAASGHGNMVLLAGEAGIGKTRLLLEFRERLTNGRAACGVGQCREFGTLPYGPVAEALRDVGCGAPVIDAPTRAARLAALQRLLEASAARRNTVLVLEDLQWADDGTMEFLVHVAPALPGTRVLIVATYRSEDVDARHAIAPFLARLARQGSCRTMALEPLPAAQTRRLVRLTLPARGLLSAERIEEIVERSDGNPFFAEELTKSALERRAQRRFRDALPLTIRAAVSERLARLEPGARGIVRLAAVAGRQFRTELLATVSGRRLAEIYDVVRSLRDLNVVDEIGGTPVAYAFRHALTREAICDEMLAGELRALHAEILAALEAAGASAQDLGYHAAEALDAERTVRYNEQAGDEADALHAYGDAVRCYERALRASSASGDRARLLAKAAASSARKGRSQRAVELYEAAIAAYARAGDTSRLAELELATASQARHTGDTERAMDLVHRALDHVPADAALLRVRLRATLAIMHLDRGEIGQARGVLNACAAEGDAVPEYQNAVAYAAITAGDVAAHRAASDRYVATCSAISPESRLRARFNRAFGQCVLGIDAEALGELEALLPELRAHSLDSLEVLACANAALIHARAGRAEEGRLLVRRALDVPEPSTTGPIALAAAALTVGAALRDDGLIDRALSPDLVEGAFRIRINTALGRLAGPYARRLFANGERERADAVLHRALGALAIPCGATETFLAAAEIGSPPTARAVRRFLPAVEAASATPLYAATGAHLRALAARRAGDAGAASAAFAEAAAVYRTMGWVTHEARCLECCGAGRAAAAALRRVRAPGEKRRVPRAGAHVGAHDALSAREREIATLVARGTPNRTLAERLSVSQRTIEKHLTSIYGKLGLRNRSELAAFVATRDD